MILKIPAILSITVLIVITFGSCVSNRPDSGTKRIEVIEDRFRHLLPSEGEFSKPLLYTNVKVWYKDSLSIETINGFFSEENSKGTIEKDSVMYYRFSDLRKGSVYEYKNFSDTSKLIRKYAYRDSVKSIGRGWEFIYERKWKYNGEPEILPDTIIDKVNFKRLRVFKGTPELPYIMVCYFRCDMKGTVFNLSPSISEITGCPMVKLYHYSPIKKGLHISEEIKFLANSFTPEEQKVFDAWERYAKRNPVKK